MSHAGNQIVAENPAGKSARELARRRYLIRICLVLLGIAAGLCIHQLGSYITRIPTFLACIAGLVALDRLLIPFLDRSNSRESDICRGAEAEGSIDATLDRLSTGWTVLHHVTASYGNIEHVVLRADGAVFVIETKSHHGRVTEDRGELRLNGKPFEKDLIRQTHANVFWLREFLKGRFRVEPWINAAIVFPNASVSVRRPLRGVDVINSSFLDRWLARARGNPKVAQTLRLQTGKLKLELLARR